MATIEELRAKRDAQVFAWFFDDGELSAQRIGGSWAHPSDGYEIACEFVRSNLRDVNLDEDGQPVVVAVQRGVNPVEVYQVYVDVIAVGKKDAEQRFAKHPAHSGKRPVYVARCPGCQSVVGAAADDPRWIGHLASDISQWIRSGYVIEHSPIPVMMQRCTCKRGENDPTLFEGAT